MARHATACRAMTLLELIAVVLIIGLVGGMAAMRYGGPAIADVGARGFARRLATDCQQAQRRAISTGDDHLLRFSFSGGSATQYALYRQQSGGDVRVDDIRTVPDDVTVTTGGVVDVEFTFTGEALASYSITVQGPDRGWTVTVVQLTGQTLVDEL
jgi:type II secretory pathway pseudopilin PulG